MGPYAAPHVSHISHFNLFFKGAQHFVASTTIGGLLTAQKKLDVAPHPEYVSWGGAQARPSVAPSSRSFSSTVSRSFSGTRLFASVWRDRLTRSTRLLRWGERTRET